MRRQTMLTMLSLLSTLLVPLCLHAGSLDNPNSPAAGSWMPTTLDIFNRLATGAAITVPGTFQEPAAAPGSTGKSLADIGGILPSPDNVAGAVAGNVLLGKTFWGLRTDGTWGVTSGTMPNQGVASFMPGASEIPVPPGYYSGGTVHTDANLISSNIRSGVTVFGVSGAPYVVDTSSGTADGSHILNGMKAWVNGLLVTGSIPVGTSFTGAEGKIAIPIPKAYYEGLLTVTATAKDADLVPGNIRQNVSVFNVAGTLIEASGTATAAQVLESVTFSNATGSGLSGSMPDNGAITITPGAASKPIPTGYHNGSGTVSGDADLAAGNIKSGVTIFGVTGTVAAPTGNAVAGQVFSGATFSNASGTGLTGTMPNNGKVILTPGTSLVPIAAGYHNGSGYVAGDVDLVSANIKSGKTIFGVAGKQEVVDTYELKDPAAAEHITNGKKAFVNGALVTGTLYGGHTCTGSLVNARFCDNGDGTIRDMNTGLIWLKNANCSATLGGVSKTDRLTWGDASVWASYMQSGYCGLTDGSGGGEWRLPTYLELAVFANTVLVSAPQNFTNIQSGNYWSSTNLANAAYVTNLSTSVESQITKATASYVWPVRSGQ